MTMKSVRWHTLALIGLLTGLSSAIFGIGGSAVLIPALLLICRYEQKQATVTTLAVSLPSVVVGLITYGILQSSAGFLNFFNLAFALISSAVIGTFLGSHLLKKFHNPTLTMLFTMVLMTVGLRMIGAINISIHPYHDTALGLVLIIAGFLAGTGNALLGIGGGAILVPTLYLFAGLTEHQAVIMSLVVIGPTTVISLFHHRKSTLIHRGHIRILIPAALFGAVMGAFIGNRLSGAVLSEGFGLFLIIFAVYTFIYTLFTGFFKNKQRQGEVSDIANVL